MLKPTKRLFFAVLALVLPLLGQETDATVFERIRTEAMGHSHVMAYAKGITHFGPRETNSSELGATQAWLAKQIRLPVQVDEWKGFGRGWEPKKASATLLEPVHKTLQAVPYSWSESGKVEGEVEVITLGSISQIIDQYKGKLKGKIIFFGKPLEKPKTALGLERYTAKDLSELTSPALSCPAFDPAAAFKPPLTAEEIRCFGITSPITASDSLDTLYRGGRNRLWKFQREEGVAGIVKGSQYWWSILPPVFEDSRKADDVIPPPGIVLTAKDFAEISQLAKQGRVRMKFESQAVAIPPTTSRSQIFSIHGTTDEIVMVGAHLDTFGYSTGAQDDGAGSAVVMELARIYSALGQPKRTIRFVFWTGEEHMLLGSRSFVQGNDLSRVVCYLNLDEGGGRIRAVYAKNNPTATAVLQRWVSRLSPFGTATVAVREAVAGREDSQPFFEAGIPTVQFFQDPLWYDLHHTTGDRFKTLNANDLKQAVVSAAWILYQAANKELLPRPQPLIKR